MKIKTAYLGLLLAFALILSYIEVLIPFSFGIPGVKLGLANLAVVLAFYLSGCREACLLTILKAVLSSFLFGNMSMLLYSLAGAVFSFLTMALMYRSGRFHLPVVSAAGGVMHNAGQLLVAFFVIRIYAVWYYVPVLILAGLATGILIGITAALVLPNIRQIIKRGTEL